MPSLYRDVDAHEKICRSFKKGKTMQEIAETYKCSREFIRQILKRYDLTGIDGGRAKKQKKKLPLVLKLAIDKRQVSLARREKECFSVWGMSFFELQEEINRYGHPYEKGSRLCRYRQQRANSKLRGIEWLITFPEWIDIWDKSGKWNMRGRGKSGYVMGRIGDTGPYSVDNVYICTAAENSADQYISGKPRKISQMALKFGKGWTYCPREKLPYRVQAHGKRYEAYATPEEANARYMQIKMEIISKLSK